MPAVLVRLRDRRLVGRRGLVQPRPGLAGDEGRHGLHLVLGHLGHDPAHDFVLARARLEVTELEVEIALLLARRSPGFPG